VLIAGVSRLHPLWLFQLLHRLRRCRPKGLESQPWVAVDTASDSARVFAVRLASTSIAVRVTTVHVTASGAGVQSKPSRPAKRKRDSDESKTVSSAGGEDGAEGDGGSLTPPKVIDSRLEVVWTEPDDEPGAREVASGLGTMEQPT